jgi:carbon-monoxide dehydrogenase large subunit
MSAPISGAGRYVGQRVLRKEDLRLLTGRGTFVDDVTVPGLLHVAFIRSEIARGRITSMDLSEARAVPGVRAVLTAEDLGRYNVVLSNMHMVDVGGPAARPLSGDYVTYVGDPVAMVVAENRYIAEDAASLAYIEYEADDPVVTISDAMTGPMVHPGDETNVVREVNTPPNPDIDAIFESAAHVVTANLQHQRIAQSTMETRGVVSNPTGEGELTVHIGCQSPHIAAGVIAIAFDIPQTKVRVIAKDVGGGFGLKSQPWREEIAAIAASLLFRRPVKWIEDRLEALTTSNASREQEISVRMAFDANAILLAMDVDYSANNGAYPHMPDAGMPVMMFFTGPYKVRNYRFRGRGWHTNTVGLGGYRGPWAIEALARETVLDKAAKQIGIDPIELRRRNLVSAADLPAKNPLGIPMDDITPIECLDQLLTKIDVAAFRAEQAAARAEGRYLGLGIATYIEPTAMTGIMPLNSDVAHIRIEQDGKVTANLSTHSQGHGIETTHAQVIADHLGVPIEDISIFQEDSTRSGFGPGAAGSRQAVIAGGAVIRASKLLVDKIKQIAAHALNANPDDVTVEDGMVRVAGAEEMSRSVKEIAQMAYGEPHRLPPGMEMGLEAQYRYSPPSFVTHATAAHACVVEVDAETGFVKIKRWICSEDCGVLINPAIVEGQIAGGVAQAIGCVLLEEFTFDERANPTAVTFKDYLMPTMSDVPDFEYTHITTPAKGDGGFRGVGEGGMIIGAPTLVNAIADALSPFGPLPDDLPLTPSKLLKLMEDSEAG